LIRPLHVRDGATRADGDVHAGGNPHFLLDPLQGFKVAKAVTAALSRLRPAQAAAFEARYAQFRQDLGRRLFGAGLADSLDVEKLAELAEAGRLHGFLKAQGLQDRLGGWLGTAQAWAGKAVVDDHPLWAYFARSFGLRIVGLQSLVGLMKKEDAQAVLASAYYDRRHADWVARHSGAKVALLANQMGSRPGTDDYLSWMDYNVKTLDQALRR
jgi:ABC-type Zn uptake system ZnuABC Zn-binding protein ZnuA